MKTEWTEKDWSPSETMKFNKRVTKSGVVVVSFTRLKQRSAGFTTMTDEELEEYNKNAFGTTKQH